MDFEITATDRKRAAEFVIRGLGYAPRDINLAPLEEAVANAFAAERERIADRFQKLPYPGTLMGAKYIRSLGNEGG